MGEEFLAHKKKSHTVRWKARDGSEAEEPPPAPHLGCRVIVGTWGGDRDASLVP